MQRLCSQAVLARTTRLREQHSEEALTTRLWEELSLATKMQQTLSGVGEQASPHAHPKPIRAAAAWRTRTPTPHPNPSPQPLTPSPRLTPGVVVSKYLILPGVALRAAHGPCHARATAAPARLPHLAHRAPPRPVRRRRGAPALAPPHPRHTPRTPLPECREAVRAGRHAGVLHARCMPAAAVCASRRSPQAAAIPSRHPPGLHAR